MNIRKSSAFIAVMFYFPMASRFIGSMSIIQAIINVVIVSAGLFLIATKTRPVYVTNHLKLSGFFLFSAAILLLLNLYFDGMPSRIASDVGRLFFAAVYIFIGAYIYDSLDEPDISISNLYIKYCIFGFLFSFLVFIPPLFPLVDLFKGRMSDDSVVFHFFRFSGFAGYPTDFGCSLVLGFLIALSQFRRNLIANKKFTLFFIVVILGIVGSASRAAILQFVGLIIILAMVYRRQYTRMLILASCALISGLIFFSLQSEESSEGYSISTYLNVDLDNPDDSISHRAGEVQYSLDVLSGREPIPVGAERDHPFGFDVIEGFWTHYIIRYGYFGILIGGGVSAFILVMLFKSRNNSTMGWALYYWYLSFILFVAPFSDVTTRFRGLPLYFVLIGMALAVRKANSRAVMP